MSELLRLDVALHPGQLAMHNSQARFKICAAGRRFGKTHLAACELLLNGLKDEHRGNRLTDEHEVYYISPTYEQGKRNIWRKLKNIGRFEQDGGVIAQAHENAGTLTLVNGRRISVKGADDPDTLRGVGIQYVVMDEYATMRPTVWDEIIEPSLIDVAGDAMFIGTPKGKNHFYELFMGALEKREGYEDWEAFSFKTLDNPTLKDEEKMRLFKNPRYSVELRRQELEASFITRGGGHFKEEWWQFSNEEPADGYYVVAVDLAGFKKGAIGEAKKKDDETAIAVVKIHEKGWWVKEIVHGRWDTKETATQIVAAASRCHAHRIGIEKTSLMYAVMPYIQDVMRQRSMFFQIEPVTHGNQRKEDRISWALQGRLERGRLTLNCNPKADFYERPKWIVRLIEQANDFPSPLVKDDLLDALAYADQLGGAVYIPELRGYDDWQPLDIIAGY